MTSGSRGFAGVLLAAGRSSRMGRAKALLTFEGATVLARLVDVFRASALEPIVVVAGPDTVAAARRISSVRVVEGDSNAPMIDSLARALETLSDRDGAVAQPIDAPFTTTTMIQRLIAGPLGQARVLAYRGAPGHPVLIPERLFKTISERPDGGLRQVLAQEPTARVEQDDERVLADLDTPADLTRWSS